MVREVAKGLSADRGRVVARPAETDRFHNQSSPSPESFAHTIDDLQAAIQTLEERLASMSAELTYQVEGVEHRAESATRRLALDVVEMGEALSRRIRAQPIEGFAPQVKPPVRPASNNFITIGVSGALFLGLAALAWNVFHRPMAATAVRPPPPVAAALYAPAPPPPPAPPVAVASPVQPARFAPRHHPRAKAFLHRRVYARPQLAPPPAPAPLPAITPGIGTRPAAGPSPG